MIKDIFYHPLFVANLWIVLIIIGFKATEYLDICAMNAAIIVSIVVMNIIAFHIQMATKYINSNNQK